MEKGTNKLGRIFSIGIIMSLILAGCSSSSKNPNDENLEDYYKEILRIQLYDENMPEDLKIIDWKERALGFDNLVFDKEREEAYLPLIWDDKTYDSFGIPAYVGDGRIHNDGSQEAVTLISSIISATLNGVDKSEGIDYVSQLDAFYSEEEEIILNNPSGSSATTSMWYLLYPTILFAQVSDLYPENTMIQERLMSAIESWYGAYEVMYNNGDSSFDYTGFNFKTNTPYDNDVWTEPDSAVGIGLLMYYGYEITNDEKYIEAAINSLDYMTNYFGSPLYEALMYFGPYLASKLNAFHGTNYDITLFLDHNFNASSIPRGGWGSVIGNWGDYDMSGLFGSDTDGGGYVFAMNTFAAAGAIAPTVNYDSRYAKDIGIWLLNLASNARYYFSTETKTSHQSLSKMDNSDQIDQDIIQYIPYEGIRKSSQGHTPWFGGDPTVYGWAETDFSLYSGAHIGVLGALIEETNIEGILEVDLQSTQFFNEDSFESYLLYNPHTNSKKVKYQIKNDNEVDLYNSVTNSIIETNITKEVEIEIPADTAYVITEIPAGSEITEDEKNFYIDGIYIGSKQFTAKVKSPERNDSVSGDIELDIQLISNYDAKVDKVTVTIDEEEFEFKSNEKVVIKTDDFTKGNKWLEIEVKSEDGNVDVTKHRIKFE